MMLFVTLIVLFGDSFKLVNSYWFFLQTSIPRPILAIIGFFSICLLFIPFHLVFRNKGANPKMQRRNLLVYGVLFFVLTSAIVFSYFFSTGWDVQIIMDTARSMAYDGTKANQWYYQECPNNIFITEIYAVILWICKPLHLGRYDFFSVLVVQNILSTLAMLMIYQTVFAIFRKRDIAAYSAFLYTVVAGLTPWMSIPYSDAFSIIFPTSLVWIYTCDCFGSHQKLRWFLMAVVAVIGFKIKPHNSFVFIAIVLYETVRILQNRHRFRSFKRIVVHNTSALFLGFVISLALTTVCCRMFQSGSQKEFGAAHYFMMGMNKSGYGVWNADDVTYAREFSTNRERNKAEFSKALSRIHNMGFKGTFRHLCGKTMLTFYDGTFNWGYEGEFYKELHPEVIPSLSKFTKSIYYNREFEGRHYDLWSNFINAIWYGCLILVFLAAFNRYHKSFSIIMIALIMLILFQLTFETRSRYLISSLPLFIIMCTIGINLIFNIIEILTTKKQLS